MKRTQWFSCFYWSHTSQERIWAHCFLLWSQLFCSIFIVHLLVKRSCRKTVLLKLTWIVRPLEWKYNSKTALVKVNWNEQKRNTSREESIERYSRLFTRFGFQQRQKSRKKYTSRDEWNEPHIRNSSAYVIVSQVDRYKRPRWYDIELIQDNRKISAALGLTF